jgi:hypothetical protein
MSDFNKAMPEKSFVQAAKQMEEVSSTLLSHFELSYSALNQFCRHWVTSRSTLEASRPEFSPDGRGAGQARCSHNTHHGPSVLTRA